MERPDKIGTYKVTVFAGERAEVYESTAYWDGGNWGKLRDTNGCHWHPNNLILDFKEPNVAG